MAVCKQSSRQRGWTTVAADIQRHGFGRFEPQVAAMQMLGIRAVRTG
jgi:hypothetical protein